MVPPGCALAQSACRSCEVRVGDAALFVGGVAGSEDAQGEAAVNAVVCFGRDQVALAAGGWKLRTAAERGDGVIVVVSREGNALRVDSRPRAERRDDDAHAH